MTLLRDTFQPRATTGVSHPHDLIAEHSLLMMRRLNAMTEQWLMKAIAAGPGFNVWRSGPFAKDGDPFVMEWRFALLSPGVAAWTAGPGIISEQPELTDGERARLLAGRSDWREHSWQDHCGVEDCGHPSCERYRENMA